MSAAILTGDSEQLRYGPEAGQHGPPTGQHGPPTGQHGPACRLPPAGLLALLSGVAGQHLRVRPDGATLSCQPGSVRWQPPPPRIGAALRLAAGDTACVLDLDCACDGEPGIAATAYLTPRFGCTCAAGTSGGQTGADWAGCADLHTGALSVQVLAPPAGLARRLQLAGGQPAFLVTARLDDPADQPAAVTVAALRPDAFRVVLRPALPAG